MNPELSFISIGCNRIAGCSQWGKNNIFAYAAQKFVALYDPIKNKVIATLKGHSERVNGVRWIPHDSDSNFGHEHQLVSVGVDGLLIVWTLNKESFQYESHQVLKNHSQSVTSVSVISNTECSFIGCTSADGTVSIWSRGNSSNSESFVLNSVLSFGNKMMESCALSFLPNSSIPCVVTGGLDFVIHVYLPTNTINQEYTEFKQACVLQGHEDWIRAMEFTTLDDGSVMLASASQDYRVRLWKFSKLQQNGSSQINDPSENSLLSSDSRKVVGNKKGMALSKSGHIIRVADQSELSYSVIFEALLTGHEDWVHSVNWHPKIKDETTGVVTQPLQLLTSSMDRTMMIWEPHAESGIWIDKVRMGEFGGLSGLFGQMGYFGGYFAPGGTMVMGHGYHGSFHLWKYETETNEWVPRVSISGHANAVMDCSWDPHQNYFVSTSVDQTTRLFAPWVHNQNSWHEIGRPQIHGYDLMCMTFVNAEKEHVLVTGADEKVLRVFEAPASFLQSLQNISGVQSDMTVDRALGASVPALGLSNKPIQSGEQDPNTKHEFRSIMDEDDESVFVPVTLEQPPFEQTLLQNTLWPETQKLYGHANELVCVSSNNKGSIIASACKAKTADVAAIRLWDTNTWRQLDVLQGHSLTVTQISFSPNDKYMISVSRDRHLIMYEQQELQNGGITYTPVIKSKAHERIVWGCSWSYDNNFVITGSRDKTVKIWKMDNIEEAKKIYLASASKITDEESDDKPKKKKSVSPFPLLAKMSFDSPVTACEFVDFKKYGHVVPEHQYLFAVGLEDGNIVICTIVDGTTPEIVCKIEPQLCHVETVRRLQWRQIKKENDQYSWQLVSCSTDTSVRLFDFN